MCLKLSYLTEILGRQTVHHDVDLLLDCHINCKGVQTPYLQKDWGFGVKFATTVQSSQYYMWYYYNITAKLPNETIKNKWPNPMVRVSGV
jgi:hypothetical protein